MSSFAAGTAQAKTQREVYNRTAQLAEDSADTELRGLRTRQLQERESASQQILSIALEAMQRRGAARLAALESGVGGETVRLVDRDFTQQGLNLSYGVERNLEFVEEQLNRDAFAVRQRQYARVLDAVPTSSGPSILEPLLGISLSIAEAKLAGQT